MANEYKPKPKKVNVDKTKSVKIVDFQAMALPGIVPGNVNVIIFGLGDDERIYQWNGDQEKWTYETLRS